MSGISTERLVTLYNKEQNPKAKIRLQCAILRKKGKTQSEISEATNWPIQTISDTLRRFEDRGLEG
ncbi:MAG: helix-turn-helix domain-containing protein, partial [Candidatus Marsarchaeota archaeon]|nr:helix-turn-helix domain-containing protein [Candidatus Marsarchaeota archaeon]